jgi:subtilisin family serine protease
LKNNIKGILFIIASIIVINTSYLSKIINLDNNLQIKSVQASSNISKNYEKSDYSVQWFIPQTKSDKALKILKQKKEIKVAIVDTGVDYTHPELKNRVLKDLGYNFINNSKDTMDDNWHGTHVAGIIAADASKGTNVSGITGNTDVKIIPIKVLDKNGQGSSDIMAKGIRYAADQGADIINFSVGFKVKDSFIEDAIKYAKNKGVFVVVSAGNDGINCDNSSPSGDNGAYTVSSLNQENERSVFSNFGNSVKISAPGEEILSTVPNGDYEYKNGTSMAAPIVAGVAALIMEENPNLSADDVADILDKTAVDIMNKGKDVDTGYGLVDAYAAVKMADTYTNDNIIVRDFSVIIAYIKDRLL